jgi:hypothetical protein
MIFLSILLFLAYVPYFEKYEITLLCVCARMLVCLCIPPPPPINF